MPTITANANGLQTFLKRQPIDSRHLKKQDLRAFDHGEKVEAAEILDAPGSYCKVRLPNDFGWWYAFEPHWILPKFNPNPLAVPNHSQRNNEVSPEASCGPTSITAVLRFHGCEWPGGFQQMEDDLSDWILENYGHPLGNHSALADGVEVFSRGKLRDKFVTDFTIPMMVREIDQGRPVVTSGFFTVSGHVVVIAGYKKDPKGTITSLTCLDPWGDWTTGYSKKSSGIYDYPAGKVLDVLDRDGQWWAHLISKT